MSKLTSKVKLTDKDDIEINPASNEKLDEVITAINNGGGGGGGGASVVGIKDEADVRITPAKETTQISLRQLLEGILEMAQNLRVLGAVRGVLADLRVNVINTPAVTVSSGTVTTVTTVSTVTTVGTVSNQTSMGGYLANQIVPSQQNLVAVMSNINNIKIT